MTLPVFFRDSRKPPQRGTNENTNRLLRHYLGKTANLTATTRDQLDAIEQRLNNRPRRVLEWSTPTHASTSRATVEQEGDRSTCCEDRQV